VRHFFDALKFYSLMRLEKKIQKSIERELHPPSLSSIKHVHSRGRKYLTFRNCYRHEGFLTLSRPTHFLVFVSAFYMNLINYVVICFCQLYLVVTRKSLQVLRFNPQNVNYGRLIVVYVRHGVQKCLIFREPRILRYCTTEVNGKSKSKVNP
jgi:hypothetical protein